MRDIKRWLVALAASAALVGGAAPIAQGSDVPVAHCHTGSAPVALGREV
jgi:hypothetical protein